jgi:hypothetical protein
MAPKKFGNCFHSRDISVRIPYYGGPSLVAHKGELDTDLSIGYHCIAKDMAFDEPHSHPFPELLCFIGGDPENISDFGAEVEFTIGGETHKITQSTVVSIPGDIEHCPIKIKNVTRPFIFLEVSATRIWKPGGRNTKKKADKINKVDLIEKMNKSAAKKSVATAAKKSSRTTAKKTTRKKEQ